MTRFLWLWVLLAILSLILGPWWHAKTYPNFFCDCNATEEIATPPNASITPPVTPPPTTQQPAANMAFNWTDGNQFFQAVEDFSFAKSGATPTVPAETKNAFQRVADYLKNSTQRQLNLTGLFTSEETKPANFPDLGIARAEAIKDMLVGMGAPAASILTNSRQLGFLPFNDTTNMVMGKAVLNTLFGDLTSAAELSASEAQALSELGESLRSSPMNVYFNTGQSDIRFPDEVKKYLADAKEYFKKVPKARLSVTGHTDDRGARAMNLRLARDRAARVSNFLVQQGFNSSRLIIDSHGPDKPIQSNATEAGRSKNRRVEIRVVE